MLTAVNMPWRTAFDKRLFLPFHGGNHSMAIDYPAHFPQETQGLDQAPAPNKSHMATEVNGSRIWVQKMQD